MALGSWLLALPRRQFLQERVELQLAIEVREGVDVGFFLGQQRLVQRDGHIRADGSEEARELDILHLALHFRAQCPFDLVGMGEHVIDRAELLQQRHGRLLSYSLATWDIIACVTHQSQQVDDLRLILQSVFLAHLFGSHHLKTTRVARTVHEHMIRDELAVVLIRRSHIDLKSCFLTLLGQRADDVIRLKAGHFKSRYVHRFQEPEIGYMASGNKYTTVSQSSAEATEDVISNQQRYLPPMHAMLVTLKNDVDPATNLVVSVKTNRVLTSPAKKAPRPGAPARRAPRKYPRGIMTVTATNPVSSRCFSRLLLGQGYHDAVYEGEDALLTTLNIGHYTNNTTPATPFNLYAADGEYGLCIDLRDSIVNIPLAFYMSDLPFDPVTRLWFSGVNNISDALVLYDAVSDTERPIADGVYIDIQTPEKNHEVRYYIRRLGYKAPTGTDIATGYEPTETETDEVVKFIKNDHVYIMRRGQIYTILGQRVQ